MKNKKYIIIGVIVVIIAIVTFLLIRREKNVNIYEHPSTLVVENYTKHKNAVSYSKIILNKIYDYDTINLKIYYSPIDFSTDEYEIAGFIQKAQFVDNTYLIFVKKGTLPIPIKSLLSHELIHLHQMEIGDLIQTQNAQNIVYKGDTIVFADTPYEERAYEIDAISKENSVRKKLNKFLYSK